MSALAMALAVGGAACGGETGQTVTPTVQVSSPVIEDFSCVDMYPGIPGPVAHRIVAQGIIANPGGPPIQGASIEFRIENVDGEVVYTFELESPPALNIPAGESSSFYGSEEFTNSDPSFTGQFCRAVLTVNSFEMPLAGDAVVAVEEFYAP